MDHASCIIFTEATLIEIGVYKDIVVVETQTSLEFS